jgi:hypothetical protein
MKNRMVIFCCLLLVVLATGAHALPIKCLQAPERQNVCPHLIYKKAALAVALLDVDKGDIICICLSDLKVLSNTKTSKVAQIDQQATLQRMAIEYQLSAQDILTLVRN